MTRHPVIDHAVLRYLERVAGLNMEEVRSNIHLKTKTALESGAKSVTVDGYRYRIAGGRVVTVFPTAKTKRVVGAKFSDWSQKRGYKK